MKKISLAIPTYFSSKYLPVLLKSASNSKFIDEIVISDDSADALETEAIKKIIKKFNNKNIIFIENPANKGAFDNKYQAISKCSNEIVYQIDSDNITGKNLNTTLINIFDNFDENQIYYPATLKQFFYNYESKIFPNKNIVRLSLEDKIIDSFIVSNSINNNKQITVDKNIFWILNCGNFIVSKKSYLNVMKDYYENDNIPLAADALAISYLWLKSGKVILLNKDLYHFHRKREDSVSLAFKDESVKSFDYFTEKFKSL